MLVRLLDIIQLFPWRFRRLGKHFTTLRFSNILFWLVEFLFQLLEITGIFDFYDAFASLLKNARPLTEREINLAKPIFGESLRYERVRLDERAYVGPRTGNFCYVSGYTINSWNVIPDAILIHELVHVWQYHHLGIVYIPRALAAQYSPEGYDYGGVKALREAIKMNKNLLDFNYEQQADIIEDYFRLQFGIRPSWGNGTADDLGVYAHFVAQLHNFQS